MTLQLADMSSVTVFAKRRMVSVAHLQLHMNLFF